MSGPGERRITIADVAARARVSKSAVSFVFNGRRGLSEATTERILRAARELGWRPSARARALARSRPLSAGMVLRRDRMSETGWSDVVGFLDGVGAALAVTDTVLVLRVVSSRADEKEVYAGFVRESQVDCVLVGGLRTDDDRPALLTRLGLPFVVADPVAFAERGDEATRQAVSHLADLGHRRIALVGSGSLVRSRWRREAFEEETQALGLAAGPRILGDSTPASARDATERLLDLTLPPTAIVYETDLLAVAGMGAAERRGLTVPQDLSIVGLDDSPIALVSDPSLTSVRRDAEACGRACGRRLVSLIGGDDFDDTPLPQAELMVRGSTAPPSDHHTRTERHH